MIYTLGNYNHYGFKFKVHFPYAGPGGSGRCRCLL